MNATTRKAYVAIQNVDYLDVLFLFQACVKFDSTVRVIISADYSKRPQVKAQHQFLDRFSCIKSMTCM